jgi:hypothetical protein
MFIAYAVSENGNIPDSTLSQWVSGRMAGTDTAAGDWRACTRYNTL